MVKVRTDQGYADYVAKILAPNGMSFHIVDRYSSMQKFTQILSFHKNSGNLTSLLHFNDLREFGAKKVRLPANSSMRKFQQLLKNSLSDTVNLNDLPPFPKKKMMGAMEPAFLETRKTELGAFFNALLSKN